MMRGLFAVLMVFFSLSTQAFQWKDLWATPDQQAQALMQKNQFAPAKDLFTREDWKGIAAYRSGDYEQAAKLFKGLHTEQGYYNQGNALAHLGQYEQAIASYKQALSINANNQDAQHNIKVLEDLLKKDKEKQENKDQQSQQNKDQQNKDQQNKDQQNKDQQNKDQQNKDQQNKDQQNKDQQNKDQQNKDQQNKDQQSKDQQNKDQQNKEAKNKKKPKLQQDQENKGSKKQQADVQSVAMEEKKQAQEQWLKLIPDDPGGLMREKFLRDHLRRERGWYQ
ncbi:MAG: tetratricopeptide repeat protein [Legionella sp.]|nr:MAG: tetratricopeptide repeat protein [Legionella sp.]